MIVEVTNKQQKTHTFFNFDDVLWMQYNYSNKYTTVYMKYTGIYIQIAPDSKINMGVTCQEEDSAKEITVESIPRLWAQYSKGSSSLLRKV
jgi:ArsR family metal-binding transcriptional regulator